MTSCYIIDDELHAIQVLAGYVNKTPGLELLGFTENPLEGLNEFREKGYADITFVDIDMAQLSGIEVATLIGNKTSVVFTTAFPKYAVEAFEKDASDYILKPITYERFLKCINKITARTGSKKENDFFYIQCESKGKIIKLNYDDIIFVEALKNYVSIHTSDNKHLTYLTLKEMEGSLPSNRFLRIHKSFIVSIDKITNLHGNQVFFSNGAEITIGPNYREEFFSIIGEKLLKSKRK